MYETVPPPQPNVNVDPLIAYVQVKAPAAKQPVAPFVDVLVIRTDPDDAVIFG